MNDSNPTHGLVFMGSPDFALTSLDALVESGRYRPRLVVSQPDRARGRGKRVAPTPVRSRAMELGIDTLQMSKANYAEVVAEIGGLRPDVVVVVAFGIIVKSDLLEMPPHGCINVHGSVLPRHRGVSPIQAAILAGDSTTGCTTMRMDAGIDTGLVLATAETDITPADTAGSLSEKLSHLGARLLVDTLDGLLVRGDTTPVRQDEAQATYTHKIKKSDGEIHWTQPAEVVARHVRAMTPWPSAYTFVRGKRLIVGSAAPSAQRNGPPGTITALKPLTVACGEGSLVIDRVKPEGKREQTAAAFLAGHALREADTLG